MAFSTTRSRTSKLELQYSGYCGGRASRGSVKVEHSLRCPSMGPGVKWHRIERYGKTVVDLYGKGIVHSGHADDDFGDGSVLGVRAERKQRVV